MNSTTNNNNNLLNFDEIGGLVKEIIRVAIDPAHNSIILTESYNGIDLSQLSGANLAEVRCSFSDIISDIGSNVRHNIPITDLHWVTRTMFDVPDDILEDTIVAFLRKFYKIYFSLSYKVRCDRTIKPEADPSAYIKARLYEINPNFVKFEDGFFTHQLRSLEDFLSKSFALIPYRDESHPDMVSEKFKELIKVMVELSHAYDDPIQSEPDSAFAFTTCIAKPVKSLLKLAGCQLEISDRMKIATSVRNNVKVPVDNLISELEPHIVFDGPNRNSVMFCDVKGPSFQQYKTLFLNYDNSPLDMDDNFKSLMLQQANYLINTSTDIALMSDFDSLVILGLNYNEAERSIEQLKQEQQVNEEPPSIERADITFKCQFIDSNISSLTIQSVFACILLYQLNHDQWIQQTNASILCRHLGRQGLQLSRVYGKMLQEFETLIYSRWPHHKTMKNIEIDLNSLEDLEAIHVTDDSNAQIVRFKTNKYNPNFINDSSNSDKLILIKMYDNMSLIKLNALTYAETLDSDEAFKTWVVGEWSDEVRRYQAIAKYQKKNPKERIDVPEFFTHGILQITKGDTYICGGLFIAMEYIEPMEYPQGSPDIDSLVLERCKHSVKQLKKLKVKHNYISRDELIYHDKKLFLIDFSNELEYGWWDRRLNFEDIQNALEKIKGESAVKFKSNDKGDNRKRDGEVNGEINSTGESTYLENNTRKRYHNEVSSN